MATRNFACALICFFATYLMLLSSGVSAQNITCYNCSSYPDYPDCSDPIGANVPTITCDGSSQYCSKVVYTTQNITVTSRSCDLITNDTCGNINITLSSQYSDLSNYSCLVCSTDYCNSAVNYGVPFFALIAAFVSAKFL